MLCAGYRSRSFGLALDGDITVVQAGMVTGDFFSVLRTEPILGRAFTEAEEVGEAPVAVISHFVPNWWVLPVLGVIVGWTTNVLYDAARTRGESGRPQARG